MNDAVGENTCVLINRQAGQLLQRGDHDGLEATIAVDVEFIDRRRGLAEHLVGRDAYRRTIEVFHSFGAFELDITPLAIRGERVALWRSTCSGFESGEDIIEFIVVGEIDDDAKASRWVVFDTDDNDAALAELARRRFNGGGGCACRRSSLAQSRPTGCWNSDRDEYVWQKLQDRRRCRPHVSVPSCARHLQLHGAYSSVPRPQTGLLGSRARDGRRTSARQSRRAANRRGSLSSPVAVSALRTADLRSYL